MAVMVLPLFANDATSSVELIVQEIQIDQKVEKIEQIDPDQVSNAHLIELGEALMELMVPNERQHELMDEMMGGEGSQSLEAMHRSMGYSYLSGGGEASWRSGWGMMGQGMMGNWGGHMLSASPIIWLLVALLAAAIVLLAVLLAVRKYHGDGRFCEGPREILHQRYASGEISRDEYLQMLKDLT